MNANHYTTNNHRRETLLKVLNWFNRGMLSLPSGERPVIYCNGYRVLDFQLTVDNDHTLYKGEGYTIFAKTQPMPKVQFYFSIPFNVMGLSAGEIQAKEFILDENDLSLARASEAGITSDAGILILPTSPRHTGMSFYFSIHMPATFLPIDL